MRKLLPLLVLLAGFGAAALLIATGPKVVPRASEAVPPLIRVVEVAPARHQFSVNTHGSVVPRTASDLVPEVDGRVVAVSASLVSGGFFSEGDELLAIDRLDYEVALEQARAGLARAQSELSNAKKNHVRLQDLKTRGSVSDAEVDNGLNQVRVAEAVLREASARLTRSRRDLERTKMLAPYDGRVRAESVDVGQFVRRGQSIGSIYAVDYAEVRLPVPNADLAYLDLPLGTSDQADAARAPVTLTADFAGSPQQWQGEVVRTEGELDPSTRMVHVVARIARPYAQEDGGAPLAVGMFVDAEIHGRTLPGVSVLPRSALRGDNRVMVVDANNQLRFRDVDILRLVDDTVYVGAGLVAGDRVCISPLRNTADGMRVRIASDSAS
ncbi:MAG: efflux RND transporter periplasmic adaptor subunit [Pseudomonadaceae bacterium]|nr:efflux RND transporter periplasmic adaptor subunit [Pseudomonadaceae bacterium]